MKTLPANGKFSLIELPYAADALAPAISADTLSFHHGKHLQAYVNNLNAALPGSPYEGQALEDIIVSAEGPVFNNAGQIFNHNMYFSQLRAKKEGAGRPAAALAAAIDAAFGSFEAFQAEFAKQAAGLFGSGWLWLVADAAGSLSLLPCRNAATPLEAGLKPLLTADVWEHAYYLDYQNRRADYLAAFWDIIDWSVVERRFQATPSDAS